MRLRIAFIHYGGEESLMPNALVVTDEYMEDEHGGLPPYWFDQMGEASGDDVVRECFIEVPDEQVLALFDVPTVAGTMAASGSQDSGQS